MCENICFKSYYDKNNDRFYLNSKEYVGKVDTKYLIEDCYSVSIQEKTSTGEFWSFEEERIKKFAQEEKLNTTDLHVNPLGDLCVAPKNTTHYILNSKNKDAYVIKLLIPFLYSHSFFEKHKERPWLDYSHGDLGYLEAYIREKVADSRERTISTIFHLKDCGISPRKLKGHELFERVQLESEEAAKGLLKLIEDIDKFSLERYV